MRKSPVKVAEKVRRSDLDYSSTGLPVWQLQRVRAIGEATARKFTTTLSSLCEETVETIVVEAAHLPYGALLAQLGTPTFFCLLRAEAMRERLMLDIQPAILEVMLDRMLGGVGVAEKHLARRTLTEIEAALAARLARRLAKQLEQTWQKLIAGTLTIEQITDEPRLLRALPADEAMAAIVFQTTLCNQVGEMRFALPCRMLQQPPDSLSGSDAPCTAKPVAEAVVELPLLPPVTMLVIPPASQPVAGLQSASIIA